MFLIRIFTGSVVGIIFGLISGLLLLVIILAAVIVALSATGGPSECTPGGGPIAISGANSTGFQSKWDAFQATLDGGTASSVNFSESEISSRAQSYVDEQDAPFSDVRACVQDGYGEGTARFSVLGIDVKLKVRGTLDLSGSSPEAQIDDIEIGNVPGFLTAPVEALVDRAIEDALSDLEIDHDYTLTLKKGEASVAGTP